MTIFLPTTYTKGFKKYKKQGKSAGIDARQAFILENTIYSRLYGSTNFPQLIDSDFKNLRITIEYCGKNLNTIRQENFKQNTRKLYLDNHLESQIDNIVSSLSKNNIQYTDVNLKNMCYKNGVLYLIDFDSAIIDNTPLSFEREHHLRNFYTAGGYNRLKRQLTILVTKYFNVTDVDTYSN